MDTTSRRVFLPWPQLSRANDPHFGQYVIIFTVSRYVTLGTAKNFYVILTQSWIIINNRPMPNVEIGSNRTTIAYHQRKPFELVQNFTWTWNTRFVWSGSAAFCYWSFSAIFNYRRKRKWSEIKHLFSKRVEFFFF